jgi:hypothetical protein
VLKITKNASELMEEETGVEPSIAEDDMKEHLYEVMEEVNEQNELN